MIFRWVERLRVVGLQRQNGETDPNAPHPDMPPDIDAVLDPQLRAEVHQDLHLHRQTFSHSPSSPLSPFIPLSPASASGRSTPGYVPSRNGSSSALGMGPPGFYTSLDAGGAAASLNALSLASHSAASSRYATPKTSHSALPSEGDGDGPMYMSRNRNGKRIVDTNGDDPTVVAATALAGLATATKRAKQDDSKDEKMDVDP